MKVSTIINSANLLKERRDKRERWISGENYGKLFFFFFNNPWREKSGIYCGPSWRWRRVSLALPTFLKISELLECPSPPLHCQGLLASAALPHWAHKSLQHGGLGSLRKEKSSVPPTCVPIRPPQGKRETGKFIADISGPFAIYKEETEWSIWSY